MLTTVESGLLVALGAILTWLTGLSSSRRQWHREERRRQADRRSALYEEMVAEVEILNRGQLVLRDAGVTSEPIAYQDKEFVDREARFNARVMLLASLEVNWLWHEWLDAFSEAWFSMNDSDYGEWQARTAAASRDLATAMRIELDAP